MTTDTQAGAEIPTRVAFGEALVDLGHKNGRVVVLDGDLANSTLVDKFADAHPDRFLEMGIAEQNMAGVAAGLAAGGLIPFVTTFAAFATNRDLDQIRVVIAQTKLHVIVVGGYSGILTGRTGKTHQCIEDIAVFRAIPNMTVLAPADATETRKAVFACAEEVPGPVYMRLTRDASPVLFDDQDSFKVGQGVVLREGSDLALISTGVQTSRTAVAAGILESEGISVHHLHLHTIKPLDEAAVIEAARTGAVVTSEDPSIIGGLGGAVAELLGERRPTLMRRVGVRDVNLESAPNDALLDKYGLTPEHVVRAAREVLATQLQDF